MKRFFFLLVFFINTVVFSQTYQPTWESLDSRPVPQWFKDAKFGIFIHWGVYSVPGYSTVGNYAEWYQNGLENGDSARIKFHKEKFGNRTYYDLANDFKAELFNPDEWAKIFEESGAKYIVLTSKHHDGFCLWPSLSANLTWGFPWNAKDVGPKRDLLGDLFKAVRKTSVHAGMYYSLYEWFNPLWKTDKTKYIKEHMWPQMKELITTYEPEVFWTDGEWDAPPETWKSQEFLAWLYNESPVKEKIVVNDRWGNGVRFHHAGIYTPEYQPDLDFEDHYWEESRGMGYSYGYNRAEDAWDYNSTQSLVLHLIDKVSRGGNFLLDIGPDEHGKIPPIMEERLLQIGEWLKINGEAIYGTSRWKIASQWSEGKQDYKARGGDVMLKLTVDPDPGYAVKEVFYTYNANTNTLYAIFPKYPENKKLVLKNINLPTDAKIEFLSTKENYSWRNENGNVIIDLPEYNPNKIKAPYAYVIKINDYGKFASKPKIKVEYKPGRLKPLITIESDEDYNLFYTTDGSMPSNRSISYSKPFVFEKSVNINVIAYAQPNYGATMKILPSSITSQEVKAYEWMPSVKAANKKSGISYNYYEPDKSINMGSFNNTAVKGSGVVNTISIEKKQRQDKFAFKFEGYIKIEKDGLYTFFTKSDDGSILYIDDTEIVNNDGDHGSEERSGIAALKKGFHKIKVLYFDSGGGNDLKVLIQPQNGKKEEVSPASLYH